MSTENTPGPWLVDASDAQHAGSGFSVIVGCGCCDSPWINGDTSEERDANARLIAAAPELLGALKGMVSSYNSNGQRTAYLVACAAIAKAEGKS